MLDVALHMAQHVRKSTKASQRSKVERTAALRAKAHALLGAEHWSVNFRGRRALGQKSKTLSELGFRLTGNLNAFRR